ncbi:hypothetical protein F5887DRAFT_921659 [Amanita rubescens]|nr:hypothetical protein F5887DRAFT_921659 [Amanita rubescens]
MPRPRLYHSPEEKRATNREKSKRHYDKCHHFRGTGTRLIYKLGDNQNTGKDCKEIVARSLRPPKFNTIVRSPHFSLPLDPVVHAFPTKKSECRSPGDNRQKNVVYWREQAKQAHNAFLANIGPSPMAYVETVYQAFIEKKDDMIIENATTKILRFQTELMNCENHVLQVDGVGEELHAIQKKGYDVSSVIRWLEEIWCYALSDIPELIKLHTLSKLMYQAPAI